jgi:hypothetical protein
MLGSDAAQYQRRFYIWTLRRHALTDIPSKEDKSHEVGYSRS